MGTRDSRAAHGAEGKKDVLLFDPEKVVIVERDDDELSDARAHEDPSEAFIENVKLMGVVEPVIGRKNTEDGKTEIVDGRKRTLGLREANKRLRKEGKEPHRLPVIIKRTAKGDAAAIMVALNELREPDSPSNLARKLAKLIEYGKTEDEVAVIAGKSKATVKNLLALIDASAALRNAVDSGKVTASDGYKLAKLPVEEQREKVAKLIEHAPRTPGKKRSPNAKKARAIVNGDAKPRKTKTNGHGDSEVVRGRNQIENVAREILEGDRLTEQAKQAIQSLVRWLLGEDKALGELGL
jgi:ParB family chromosome partitioning protein